VSTPTRARITAMESRRVASERKSGQSSTESGVASVSSSSKSIRCPTVWPTASTRSSSLSSSSDRSVFISSAAHSVLWGTAAKPPKRGPVQELLSLTAA
jgi:hypothetical protein